MVLIEESCVEKILISISKKTKKKFYSVTNIQPKSARERNPYRPFTRTKNAFFEKAFYIFVLILSFVYILARTSLL